MSAPAHATALSRPFLTVPRVDAHSDAPTLVEVGSMIHGALWWAGLDGWDFLQERRRHGLRRFTG